MGQKKRKMGEYGRKGKKQKKGTLVELRAWNNYNREQSVDGGNHQYGTQFYPRVPRTGNNPQEREAEEIRSAKADLGLAG